MSTPRILVIGEALMDIVTEPDGAETEHVGGSPANVAMGLARLGHPVRLATTLGPDARGERIRAHLRQHGVRPTKRSSTADATSTARVTFDKKRNAAYEFDIRWDLAPVRVGRRVGHLHVGSLATALEPGASRARAAIAEHRDRVTVSYDPNIRPGIMGELSRIRPGVEDLVALSDVVKASSDDVGLLYPDLDLPEVIEHWLSLGAPLVVLTRGADGVVYRTRDGELVTRPTLATRVVDTVGAGDSFMAGLLSGLLGLGLIGSVAARGALRSASSEAVLPAVDRALATSAVTVEHAGAYAPEPAELWPHRPALATPQTHLREDRHG